MKRRTTVAILILSLSAIGLLIGTCSVVGYLYVHAGEGPKHVFPLAGDGAMTDREAIDLLKQIMVLDGRSSPTMKESDIQVSRGSDPNFTTVIWCTPSYRYWFVLVEHKDGKVIGLSYPGR